MPERSASAQRTSCSVVSTGWPVALLHAVGDPGIEPRALVDFVEVHERLAFVEHALAVAAADRRPIGVVERAFDQVARRQQVLEALLILNADQVAAEVVGDSHRGDVHFALLENLLVGEIGLVLRAGVELHAAVFDPLADGAGFVVADLRRFVVQRRLAEPLLEHAGRMQQVVGNDRVEHAHAAFVEDAHDRLVALRASRRASCPSSTDSAANLALLIGHDVRLVVRACGRW